MNPFTASTPRACPDAQEQVYPHDTEPVNNAGQNPQADMSTTGKIASTQFVLIPVDLIKRRDISDAEFRQAALMMSYSRVDQHEIWPEQETLAEDLGCSVRKVNRSIAKLDDAGIVPITRRLRCTKGDYKGEYRQCVYTLSKIWGMIPPKVAKQLVDHETELASDSKTPPSQKRSTTRRNWRNSKYNQGYVNEIEQHTSGDKKREAEKVGDVVVQSMNEEDMSAITLLVDAGIEKPAAVEYVVSLGSKMCRHHLEAYQKSKTAEHVGWLCSNLQNPDRTYARGKRKALYPSPGAPPSPPEPSKPATARPMDREAEKPRGSITKFGTAPALQRALLRAPSMRSHSAQTV